MDQNDAKNAHENTAQGEVLAADLVQKMIEIDAMTTKRYRAVVPRTNLRKALTADIATAGRLPTAAECATMMEGSDDDVDVEPSADLLRLFPQTLDELASVWQLCPPGFGLRRR